MSRKTNLLLPCTVELEARELNLADRLGVETAWGASVCNLLGCQVRFDMRGVGGAVVPRVASFSSERSEASSSSLTDRARFLGRV